MVSELQELKNKIWYQKQSIEKTEKERKEWADSLASAKQVLEADPGNGETKEMIPELEEGLKLVEATLMPLLEDLAALEARLPKAPEAAQPKFDPEKHPLLKKAMGKTEEDKPIKFNTGDICEAQWSDKAWYKAKIHSILGSASAPKYHVLFLDYDDTLTVDRDAIRPLPVQAKRKRELESNATSTQQNLGVASTPQIVSGPVSANPNAQAAKKDLPSELLMEPKKRKIPNRKTLEKGMNNWKNWSSKGVGKKISSKDSMFRSGTTVGSKVGFTGSGAGMTESSKRVRHNKHGEAETQYEDEQGHQPLDNRYSNGHGQSSWDQSQSRLRR